MKNKELFIVSGLIVILTGVLMYLLYHNTMLFYEFFDMGIFYYVAVIAIALLIYMGTQNSTCFMAVCTWVIIMTVVALLFDKEYSVIDETAHFDYINHIIEEGKLPTIYDMTKSGLLSAANDSTVVSTVQYEAVQPPLYYIFLSVIVGWVKNLPIRFCLGRIVGLFLLFCSIKASTHTVHTLMPVWGVNIQDKDIIAVLRVLFLAFWLNPGILLRFTRISNEGLSILLSTIFIYYLCLTLLNYSRKNLAILTGVCTLLFLTKNTGVYFWGGIFAVCVYYKRFKDLIIATIFMLLGCLPWFLYNWATYGALTGMEEHVAFVLPIVNPFNAVVDVESGLLHLFDYYFQAQEVLMSTVSGAIIGCVSILMIFLIGYAMVVALIVEFKYIKKKLKFEYNIEEKQRIIEITLVIMVGVAILSLIVASIKTRISAFMGRYMYLCTSIMIILSITAILKLSIKLCRPVIIFFSIFYGFLFTDAISTYAYFIMDSYGALGMNREYLDIASIDLEKNMILVNNADNENFAVLTEEALSHDGNLYMIKDVIDLDNGMVGFSVGGNLNLLIDESQVEIERMQEDIVNANANANLSDVRGLTLSQEFISSNDTINAVSVMVGTYTKPNITCKFHIKITDVETNEAVEKTVTVDNVRDNDWMRFSIPEIDNAKNKKYRLEISSKLEENPDMYTFYFTEFDHSLDEIMTYVGRTIDGELLLKLHGLNAQ